MKKKKNPLFIILILLFIVYISIYFSKITGYYEMKQYNKMNLTKEAMKEFETDVKEGKQINIEKYLSVKQTDYSNGFSTLGNKTSKTIEYLMTKSIKKTFKILGKMFG